MDDETITLYCLCDDLLQMIPPPKNGYLKERVFS